MKKILIVCLWAIQASGAFAQAAGRAPAGGHSSPSSEESGSCDLNVNGANDVRNKFNQAVLALAVVDQQAFRKLMGQLDNGIEAYLNKEGLYGVESRRSSVRVGQMAVAYASLNGASNLISANQKYTHLRGSLFVGLSVSGNHLAMDASSTGQSGLRPVLADLLSIPDLKQSEVDRILQNPDIDQQVTEFCDGLVSLFHMPESQRLPLRVAFKKELAKKVKKGGPRSFDLLSFLESNGYVSSEMKKAAVELNDKLEKLWTDRYSDKVDGKNDAATRAKTGAKYDTDAIKASAQELIALFEKAKTNKKLAASQLKMIEDTISELKSITELCS